MKMTMAAVVSITARTPPSIPRTVETLLELLVFCCGAVGVGLAVEVETTGAFAVAEVAVVEEAKSSSV